jgi:hypothetical protein
MIPDHPVQQPQQPRRDHCSNRYNPPPHDHGDGVIDEPTGCWIGLALIGGVIAALSELPSFQRPLYCLRRIVVGALDQVPVNVERDAGFAMP